MILMASATDSQPLLLGLHKAYTLEPSPFLDSWLSLLASTNVALPSAL